jgi:6-pyruvoyltetrahydropterin/6-carboxytetrahydropterin synthase
MIVTLKRRAAFSAAHNYSIADLSDRANKSAFGRFASSEGHGHNYRVEIAVTGAVDERTGMVVNITEIDRVLKALVITPLDGKYLNREVDCFRTRAPSTENIVRFVREQLEGQIPTEAQLTATTVWESETLWSSWQRELASDPNQATDMITLTRAYDFSASHRLHSDKLTDSENSEIFGKCNNPNGHGHNYEVEVSVTGTPDERSGMIYSLDDLDKAVEEEVLAVMDHKHLNLDVAEFKNVNPTSEMLAVVIWNRLAKRLPVEGNPKMSKVLVRETARNFFEYCGN